MGIHATGGNESTITVGSTKYRVHEFTTSGNFVVTEASGTNKNVEYLIIGGAGRGIGSVSSGGGGGGGGLLTNLGGTGLEVSAQTYSIVVGKGNGAEVTNAGGATSTNKGDDSSALGLTAIGGGNGAVPGNTAAEAKGNDGGSGGGGAATGTVGVNGTPGSGTSGQGYDGGAGYGSETANDRASGGGGGAGEAGGNAAVKVGGKGGDGLQNAITGTNKYYSGGGGGGTRNGGGGTPGAGGLGGGVTGGIGGVLGTAGGGGAYFSGSGQSGGNGGVVIRYVIEDITVNASKMTASALMEDPAVTKTEDINIQEGSMSASALMEGVIVQLETGITVEATNFVASATFLNATVTAGATTEAETMTASLDIYDPTVETTENISVNADLMTCLALMRNPSTAAGLTYNASRMNLSASMRHPFRVIGYVPHPYTDLVISKNPSFLQTFTGGNIEDSIKLYTSANFNSSFNARYERSEGAKWANWSLKVTPGIVSPGKVITGPPAGGSNNYSQFHYETWLRFDSVSEQKTIMLISSSSNPSLPSNFSNVEITTDKKVLWRTKNFGGQNENVLTSNIGLKGVWNHIAVNWNNTTRTKQIFINGYLAGSYTYPSGTSVILARYVFTPYESGLSNGLFDHVALWLNTTLPTQQEIFQRASFLDNYENVTLGHGPSGYLRFNQNLNDMVQNGLTRSNTSALNPQYDTTIKKNGTASRKFSANANSGHTNFAWPVTQGAGEAAHYWGEFWFYIPDSYNLNIADRPAPQGVGPNDFWDIGSRSELISARRIADGRSSGILIGNTRRRSGPFPFTTVGTRDLRLMLTFFNTDSQFNDVGGPSPFYDFDYQFVNADRGKWIHFAYSIRNRKDIDSGNLDSWNVRFYKDGTKLFDQNYSGTTYQRVAEAFRVYQTGLFADGLLIDDFVFWADALGNPILLENDLSQRIAINNSYKKEPLPTTSNALMYDAQKADIAFVDTFSASASMLDAVVEADPFNDIPVDTMYASALMFDESRIETGSSVLPDAMFASALMNEVALENIIQVEKMTASAKINEVEVQTGITIDVETMNASAALLGVGISTGESIEELVNAATANAEFLNPGVFVGIEVIAENMTANATMNEIDEINLSISLDVFVMSASALMNDVEIAKFVINNAEPMKAYATSYFTQLVPQQSGAYYSYLRSTCTKLVGNTEQRPESYWNTLIYNGYDSEIPTKEVVAGSQLYNNPITWFIPFESDTKVKTEPFQNLTLPVDYAVNQNDFPYINIFEESASTSPVFNSDNRGNGQVVLNGRRYMSVPERYTQVGGQTFTSNITGSYYGSYDIKFSTARTNAVILSTNNRTLSTSRTQPPTQIPSPKAERYAYGATLVNGDWTYPSLASSVPDEQYGETNAQYAIYDDQEWVRFTETSAYKNYGEVKIVDGKIAFLYKNRLTGEEKVYRGKTNISDNRAHYMTVNRTIDSFGNDNKADKKKKSCLEIWVDGRLEVRTEEIDDSFWFNNFSYIGIGYDYKPSGDIRFGAARAWRPIVKENEIFVGGISLFVNRNARPLTENEIKLIHLAWRDQPFVVSDSQNVEAKLLEPQVVTDSAKVLRLFWNLDDVSGNGLVTSDPFNVKTYSVTQKLLNSPSETFNLDEQKIDFDEKLPVSTVATEWLSVVDPAGMNVAGVGNVIFASEGPLSSERYGKGPKGQKFLPEFIVSGHSLQNGERVLLIGQKDASENGVYVFNGLGNPLTRAQDLNSPSKIENSVIYVKGGNFEGKYFACLNKNITMADQQSLSLRKGRTTEFIWKEISFNKDMSVSFIADDYWRDDRGFARFIDLDTDVENFDVITFMNFPKNTQEIAQQIPDYDFSYVVSEYERLVRQIKNAVVAGKKLFVNSPILAADLKLVTNIEEIEQGDFSQDVIAALENPFEKGQPADRYFNNNRVNKYKVLASVEGLNDKETYVLRDFINFVPAEKWKDDEYHAKYEYKETGHEVDDEFIIPSMPLRSNQIDEYSINASSNQIGSRNIYGVPSDAIVSGTAVTSFTGTYDDYVNTFILEPGDTIEGQTIAGKVFVTLVEDGLTMAQEEYNRGILQNVPEGTMGEDEDTLAWQYSTSRIDRELLQDIETNINRLGQTVSNNNGGGPVIQAPTNTSDGTIRNKTDKDNEDRLPVLYPDVSEEKYPITEIPVLSMTYLGLKWLGGI